MCAFSSRVGMKDRPISPRMHGYVIACAGYIVPALQVHFPEAQLSNRGVANKLAVCTGDGSSYDKHLDNTGAISFVRKCSCSKVSLYVPVCMLMLQNCICPNLTGIKDTRKVTVIYYLNKNWNSSLGGMFRIFNPRSTVEVGSQEGIFANDQDGSIDIAPIGGRLFAFWSDQLIHSVTPSFAPQGRSENRFALTVWLRTASPSAIVRNWPEIEEHFGISE